MPARPTGSSFNHRLAQAETLLVLALFTEGVVQPWLFSHPELPAAGKTLLKMALIVGLFGPVRKLLSRCIDDGLATTRDVTRGFLSVPRAGAHALILAALFTSFFYSMHHRLPWEGPRRVPAALSARDR